MTTVILTPIEELKEGDIVWAHGLRLELGTVHRWTYYDGQTCCSSKGKVLNPEVFEDEGMRLLFGGLIDFKKPYWTIQSIGRVYCNKEVCK